MMSFLRTDSNHPDFINLCLLLDRDIAERTPERNEFFSQNNKIDLIEHVIVAYHDNEPISCGAIKKYDNQTMEIKRMFTSQGYRRRGFGLRVLIELENWAVELLYKRCILQTGLRHNEAIVLYKNCGYIQIDNYGQYRNDTESICFEKKISMGQ